MGEHDSEGVARRQPCEAMARVTPETIGEVLEAIWPIMEDENFLKLLAQVLAWLCPEDQAPTAGGDA